MPIVYFGVQGLPSLGEMSQYGLGIGGILERQSFQGSGHMSKF